MVYDISPDEAVSVAVVTAVAKAENSACSDLPLLSHTVDPDALDALFAPVNGINRAHRERISFQYSESRVIIDQGERITVEPANDSAPRSDR